MINAELKVVIDHIIRVSLSKPHSNIQNGMVVHVERTTVKTRLQHTSTVWYGGSCTNKHDKVTDTACTSKNIRLHFLMFHIRLVWSNISRRMNGKDYGHCILGWYICYACGFTVMLLIKYSTLIVFLA